jgi:small-conductance mechanosensitive channel
LSLPSNAIAPLHIPIASFWTDYRNEITAVVTVLIALGLARFVDRYMLNRAARMASVVSGPLSPVATTRLRLVRRLITVAIVLFGLMLALSQFQGITRVATGILASSAVLGIVVGFAARQTLANAIAGILLAITQPIRIGDLVTFEDNTGTVEDIRLTYTYLRSDDGRRIIIPNERLAQNTLQNHTIIDPRVRVSVDVWLPAEADATRALRVLRGDDIDVQIAEIDKDGVRLEVGTWARTYQERGAVAAGLRAHSLETVRREGLSSKPGA